LAIDLLPLARLQIFSTASNKRCLKFSPSYPTPSSQSLGDLLFHLDTLILLLHHIHPTNTFNPPSFIMKIVQLIGLWVVAITTPAFGESCPRSNISSSRLLTIDTATAMNFDTHEEVVRALAGKLATQLFKHKALIQFNS
jgi:hypothetical protein